jgi:broad specificity phosphatase PhoE/predicted kinase
MRAKTPWRRARVLLDLSLPSSSIGPVATGANQKLAIVMVGLPARGKTFLARKVARYLSWSGHPTRVFNVGAYRRARLGSFQPHSFFDPGNAESERARTEVAHAALQDLLAWLEEDGAQVGVYDATNSTRERRMTVQGDCEKAGHQVVFIESICDDPDIIDANVRQTKLFSPDYVGVPADEAVRDFRLRIEHYARVYEPVLDGEGSFIKIVDVGRTVIAHLIEGYLPARLVFFLLNVHIEPRPIWLTRHGESEYNVSGRIGGDACLSPRGALYAEKLLEAMKKRAKGAEVAVWTSTLRRTIDTAERLSTTPRTWRALDEIDSGVCDGMTYKEISALFPSEYAARAADKFRYRYPRGESYQDVIQRLEPVIFELERQRSPVLIVGHQAVLRALYAYLMDLPPEACPKIPLPLHTLIELTPTAYGCDEERFELEPAPLDREGFGQGEKA